MENGRRWSMLFAVAVASVIVLGVEADEARSKRNVMELGTMVGKMTGKNIFDVYSSYNGYGCYCGLGGEGTAVDDTDRCCEVHDSCYRDAQAGVCTHEKNIYDVKYDYDSKNTNEHGAHIIIRCSPVSSYADSTTGTCAKDICECDKALSMCFSQYKYNNKYKQYDRKKC